MADNTQNFGDQNTGQNPDKQKQPESPANSQKNAFKRSRFRYAKKVKTDQAKNEVKQKIESLKPQKDQNDKTKNINRNDVNRNRNWDNRNKFRRDRQKPRKSAQGDGRGGLIGLMVNKPKNPPKVEQKNEQKPQPEVKPQQQAKPQPQVQPLNPFLVDFEPRKHAPAKELPQKPEPQKPELPKVEPKPAEPKPTEPKSVEPKKEEPKKPEPFKVEPQKIEPVKPVEPKPAEPVKVEPVRPEPPKPQPAPQKESVKPINPFIVGPKEKVEKIPEVKKQDLEPTDEGDEDLDNEITQPQVQPRPPRPPSAPQKSVSSQPFVNPFMQSDKKKEVIVGEVVEKPKVGDTTPQSKESNEKKPVEKEKNVEGGGPKQGLSQAASPSFSPGKKLDDADQEETIADVLKNIGITKQRVIYFCGAALGIGVLIAVGIWAAGIFGGQDKIPRDGEQVQEAGSNSGIVSSYLLGIQFSKNSNILKYSNYSGAILALELGGTSYVGGQYADYMDILRQMQNIYDTNVYDLIDRGTDRRALLEEHLNQMQALISRGEGIYYDIVDRMTRLNSQYEALLALQTQDENAFFEAVKGLQSESSSNYMNSFVDVSQKMIQVKAYFGAYKSFKAMFANSVNALRPRYQDILLNKEAIIQGIYVFDVPGSDIGAIIRLDTMPVE